MGRGVKTMNTAKWEIFTIAGCKIRDAAVNKTINTTKLYFTPISIKCTSGVIETIQHEVNDFKQRQ